MFEKEHELIAMLDDINDTLGDLVYELRTANLLTFAERFHLPPEELMNRLGR